MAMIIIDDGLDFFKLSVQSEEFAPYSDLYDIEFIVDFLLTMTHYWADLGGIQVKQCAFMMN